MFRYHALPMVALAAALPLATGSSQEFERRTLRSSSVEIQNVVGEITVERGSGSDVQVEIRRGGADGSRLRIEGDDAALRVVYPDDRLIYPRLGRTSRSSVRFGNDDDDRWWGGRSYEVRGSGSGTEAWADLRILVPAGKAVRVRLGVGEVNVTNVASDLHISTGSGRINSGGTTGRLRLSSGSGSVEVRGAEGEIQISTGSGSISARDMRGEQVSLRTGSGSVTAESIESPRFSAGTGSGGMRLRGVRAERVSASTGSGGVNLELLNRVEEVRISTGSGSVTLAVPERIGARVELRTGSGGISTDFPVTISGTTRRNQITGTIGDGSGTIRVTTGSGGVRLVRS